MLRDRSSRPAFEAFVILLAAFLAAIVSNALAGPERRLEWLRAPTPLAEAPPASAPRPSAAAPSSGAAAASPQKPWTEISTDEAERLFRTGVLFVDARRSGEYRQGHVTGARSMPVWEAGLDEKVKALFDERSADQSAPIVVYCNGGECEDSHELGQRLFLSGFDSVRVYRDGFPDWSRKKLPVTTGDRP
jgi:rhodanese-related sulfurtransferase